MLVNSFIFIDDTNNYCQSEIFQHKKNRTLFNFIKENDFINHNHIIHLIKKHITHFLIFIISSNTLPFKTHTGILFFLFSILLNNDFGCHPNDTLTPHNSF